MSQVTGRMMGNPQLEGIVDPVLEDEAIPETVASFLNLAQRCTCAHPIERPLMREVERELEQIIGCKVTGDATPFCGQDRVSNLGA